MVLMTLQSVSWQGIAGHDWPHRQECCRSWLSYYWGSGVLTADRYHFDFTMSLDRAVPLIPQFIWIYILAFPFWAVNYILAAQRGKDGFYRFVATDLTVHITCFIIFLVLPTTNVRPEIAGTTWSQQMLKFVYLMDGGNSPSNLFPSIHCYVAG